MKSSFIAIFLTTMMISPLAYIVDNFFDIGGHRSLFSWVGVIAMSSLAGLVCSHIFEGLSCQEKMKKWN